MNTLIIFALVLLLGLLLKGINLYTSSKQVRSLGASSNWKAANMPRYDMYDKKSVEQLRDDFRDMAD